MDGVHDLGGKQGHGPIDVHEPVEPFHSEWEARAWALSKSIGGGAPIGGGMSVKQQFRLIT